MQIKNIDHIALTVPDIDEATKFFEKAFNAQWGLEGLNKNEPPITGPQAELVFGMKKGGQVRARRVLKLNGGTNIELYEYGNMPQQRAAHTYDYGYQHFAVLVDDLAKMAHDFQAAGGKLLQTEIYQDAAKEEKSPHQGWLYGETPWGSIIEMVTFREVR